MILCKIKFCFEGKKQKTKNQIVLFKFFQKKSKKKRNKKDELKLI